VIDKKSILVINNAAFSLSALLLCVVVFFIFPLYQYNVDPDGTSYLTISARYAAGDYATAVNGLWSPWACWLTALLIKCGLAAIPASVIVNTSGALGFLFISDSLFRKFDFSVFIRWLFNITLVVFLCFAVYWQSFNDLWQAFLLLSVLRIMLSGRYSKSPLLWVATGLIASVAYYAKAYSLPFFILNTVCCAWLLTSGNKLLWVKMVVVPIAVMAICAFPWVYALHAKYGVWLASTAGPLNMSWYLVGHPYWKEGIDILVPPVYPDTPYFWEDPYLVNGIMPKFTDSWYLFGRQILKIGYNTIMMVYYMCELTILMPLVAVYILRSIIFKSFFSALSTQAKLVNISFLLLPLGYIMVHFESRYMWYMLPLAMVASVFIFQDWSKKYKWNHSLLYVLFTISIMLFPVWQLLKMANNGKAEYEYAMRLKQQFGKSIDVVSNIHPRNLSKIAYFSGIRFYLISRQVLPSDVADVSSVKEKNTIDLLKDIKKYNISYYMYAQPNSRWMKNTGFDMLYYENLKDSSGAITLPTTYTDKLSGITIFSVDY
jgi:hypothetical protein